MCHARHQVIAYYFFGTWTPSWVKLKN